MDQVLLTPLHRCGKEGSGRLSDWPGVTEPVSGHHEDLSPESDSEGRAPNHLAQGRGKPESCTLRAGGQTFPSQPAHPGGGSGPHPAPDRGHLTVGGGGPARVPDDTPALGLQPPAAHPHIALCPPSGRLRPARALTIAAAAASPARALLSPSGSGARYPGGSGGAGPRPAGAGGAPARSPDPDRRKAKAAGTRPGFARLPQPPELGASRLSSLVLALHAGHTSGAQSVTRAQWSGLRSGGIARSTSLCIRANAGHCARDASNSQPGRVFATWVTAFTGNPNPNPTPRRKV